MTRRRIIANLLSYMLCLSFFSSNLNASYNPFNDSPDTDNQNTFLKQRNIDYKSRQRSISSKKEKRRNKTKVNKLVNNIIENSAKLIDKQYDGITSVFHGSLILSKMLANIDEHFKLKMIHQESKDALKYYKSRKTLRNKRIAADEHQTLSAELQNVELPEKFKSYIQENINPLAACKYDFNLNTGIALILKLGSGFSSAICTTPSGRMFRIFGASLSIGVGLGADVGVAVGRDIINFYIPLHSSVFQAVDFKETSGSFVFGERTLKVGEVVKGLQKPWVRNQVNVGIGFDKSRGKEIFFRRSVASSFHKYKRLLEIAPAIQ